MEARNVPFLLTRTDLQDLKVDAKVIGCCPYLSSSRLNGWQPDLWAQQRRIQQMPMGDSMLTSGQEFDAKYGIVTVPPIWEGGERKEALHLAACYDSALRLAHRRRCKSIAFPLLSGECNGFPRDLALETAISVISEFLSKHEMMIYLSVKDAWAQHLPKPSIEGMERLPANKSPQELFLEAIRGGKNESSMDAPQKAGGFLKPRVPRSGSQEQKAGESFSQSLMELAQEKNLKEPLIYQKANVERKVFLKIQSSPGFHPAKTTALGFALALELNLEQTKKLIGSAGYTLLEENKADLIVSHFIRQGNYNIYEINQALFAYGEPLVGE